MREMLFQHFQDLDFDITVIMNKLYNIWSQYSLPIYETKHSVEECKLQINLLSKCNQAYSERNCV